MKMLARFGTIGASIATLSILGLSSVASASSFGIYNTGPWSNNYISWHRHSNFVRTNTNNVFVTNNNSQTAVSGNALVFGNTFGGSAISGNASNYNSTSTNISISNGW